MVHVLPFPFLSFTMGAPPLGCSRVVSVSISTAKADPKVLQPDYHPKTEDKMRIVVTRYHDSTIAVP